MRTLPLFSSVAQMPSGVVGAGAAATGAEAYTGAAATGAGAGCTSLVTGAGAAVATVVATGAATVVAGAGAGATAGAGAGVSEVTSSSSFLDLPKPPKLEPERPGAEIL